MKNILYIFSILVLLTSCEDTPVADPPDFRIYQVLNTKGITIPVSIEDNRDGSGFVIGNLLFDNIETQFTANLDYVNDDKTNFSLSVRGDQISQTFVSSTGYYSADSIFITIFRDVVGLDIEETYVGSR